MRHWSTLVAALVICGLVGWAEAARGGKGGDGKAGKNADKPLNGTIVSVDTTTIPASPTIKITPKSGGGRNKGGGQQPDVTVTTDASTTITINGVAGKISDLQPGMQVKVTQSLGKATSVEANNKGGGKEKGGKGGRGKNK